MTAQKNNWGDLPDTKKKGKVCGSLLPELFLEIFIGQNGPSARLELPNALVVLSIFSERLK